jgi:hypothetical protein
MPQPHYRCAKLVTIVGLHRLFAVSVFPFSTAWPETGRWLKTGGTTVAKRQKKTGFIERLRQSFRRFWNE